MKTETCPDREVISELLDDHLPQDDRESVETHVEQCVHCQNLLERLVQNDSAASWSRLRATRTGPAIDEEFISGIRNSVPQLSGMNIVAVERKPRPTIDDTPPKTIGRYEVIEEIGRGGMSVVYLAKQPHLGRMVAIKRLKYRDQDDADIQRFLREARILSEMPHPNIVKVYEFGEDDGPAYISLEYVPEGSLADLLKGTPADPRSAAGFMAKVADAIHHAHKNGIIHRDLKPANILLAHAENPGAGLAAFEPKVADFGLARQVDDTQHLTQPDVIAGTPAYLAPEQIGRKEVVLSSACDIYAIGVLLYEMLTGRPPFLGPTILATLKLVESAAPLPPRQLQPQVPRDLETICLKCLRKEPHRRYLSAHAVAEDLHRFLENRPIRARRAGRIETSWRWCKRNPIPAFLSTALFISLGFGIWAATGFLREARQNEKLAQQQVAQAAINARLANDRTYISNLRLANSMWSNRQLALLVDLLDGQRPEKTDGIDRRGFEWYYLWNISHPPHQVLTTTKTTPWSLSIDEDGESIAVASGEANVNLVNSMNGKSTRKLTGANRPIVRIARQRNGTMIAGVTDQGTAFVWNEKTGKLVGKPLPHTQRVLGLAFDPKNQLLATVCLDGQLRIWDTEKGIVKQTLTGSRSGLISVAYSQNGRHIVTGSRDGVVQVWETDGWVEKHHLTGHVGEVMCVEFNPEGSLIVSGSTDASIRIWSVQTGSVFRSVHHHLDTVTDLAFSPDGKSLASASFDKTLRVLDMVTFQSSAPLLGHTKPVTCVVYHPDGTKIVSSSADNTVRTWDLSGQSTDLRLTGHTKAVNAVITDPHGRFIASGSADGTIRIWDATTGTFKHVLNGPKGSVTCLVYSPDGSILASGGTDKSIQLWDVETGKIIQTLNKHTESIAAIVFSPDGRTLASVAEPRTIHLWEVSTGNYIQSYENAQRVSSLDWHPARPQLAAGTRDGFVTIYDTNTNLAIQRYHATVNEINQLHFSPDGAQLVIGGSDRILTIWNTNDWTKQKTLRGHFGSVSSVRFSPDGTRLISGSLDGSVLLWDVAEGQPLLALSAASPVTSVAAGPNGTSIVAACNSGIVRVWKSQVETRQP